MPILYRYLASHWYETLRDAEFLASSPAKFNDLFDCAGLTVGEIPHNIVSEYFDNRDWFGVFSRIVQSNGGSIDAVIDALNSENFTVENLDLSRRMSALLRNRKSVSKVWRIVCFSKLPENVLDKRITERRMWRRYADKGRGVRIGVDFSFLSKPKEEYLLHDVVYSGTPAIIDLSACTQASLSHVDFLKMLFIKVKRVWGREEEVRLVTLPRFCTDRNDMCFWSFNREIVRSVCLGEGFPANQRKGLLKMLSRCYPKELEVYEAINDGGFAEYQYKRIA